MSVDGHLHVPDDGAAPYDPECPPRDLDDGADEDASALEKTKRQFRAWEEIGRWDPTAESDEYIKSEIKRIADEKMKEGGIEHIKHLRSSPTDLGSWKQRDQHMAGDTMIVRYRCPLNCRCHCKALLKIEYGPSRTTMFMSEMHTPASHAPEKDKSKYLKWQQKQEVVSAVQVLPLVSAKQIQRNLHRTSPEKRIDPELQRYLFVYFP